MSEAQPIETWKDIEDFPGYQVSDWGRVRSSRGTGRSRAKVGNPWRILSLRPLPSGYLQVSPRRDGKNHNRYIHRLVLEAFVGPCPFGQQTRHVNENDRSNNHLSNLCWGTSQENSDDAARHGTRPIGSRTGAAKLTEEIVGTILSDAAAGASVLGLARKHGLRKENISKIVNGHYWRHVDGPRKIHESTVSGHVSTKEASAQLGVAWSAISYLIHTGRLVAVKCRRGFMVEASSLAAEVARRLG